jgi:spore coat protein U-like protein
MIGSRRRLIAFLAALLALPLAPRAWAANCIFQTLTSVAFGSYDVFSTAHLDSTATVAYSCTKSVTAPRISLSTGGGGSFSPRQLTGSLGTRANYNLYLDAARATVWGDGTGGTAYITGPDPTDTNQVFTYTIYARVFAGQDLNAGAYGDTVTVTINY